MFGGFFPWWVHQMFQMLPTRLRDRWRPDAHALIIVCNDICQNNIIKINLVIRRKGRDRDFGCFTLNETGLRSLQATIAAHRMPKVIIVRPPPNLLLERKVVLPLAAERELDLILGNEISRLTPFAKTEVFWTPSWCSGIKRAIGCTCFYCW